MSEEELIDDQFKFVMSIAAGQSSVVEEVVEVSTGRHFAMKRLLKDAPEFKENKAQMKREAEIHKNMDHPLIVKFEGYSTNRDHTYILMEYFRSSNLKVQIKSDLNKVLLKSRHLFEGVCSALAHVHQRGYIHRDIKPDNVLVNRAGEIRLCDFSLSSKQLQGVGKLFAGKLKVIQGTRTYIAPETIRRQQPTIQTDLYSLGIVFFEVLTGRPPFPAASPEELLQKHLSVAAPFASSLNPNVTPEMDRVIDKLLMKKPADRPASADEVLAELKRIRIFKEDVIDEEAAKAASRDDDALAQMSEMRLDSRADAKLKELLETNPEFARKWVEEKGRKEQAKKLSTERENARKTKVEDDEKRKAKAAGKPAPAAAAPAAPASVAPPVPMPVPMPMPMPGYPPGYPTYPPGYPGYGQGQPPMMPMPGMPQYAPQPPMGYPQPMMPQAYPPPPQVMMQPPAGPAPAATQGVPPVRPPAAPANQIPQPAPPQRTPQPAAPAKPPAPRQSQQPAPPVKPKEDLDFMTDLPDVL